MQVAPKPSDRRFISRKLRKGQFRPAAKVMGEALK
jgi:hypothetical protein